MVDDSFFDAFVGSGILPGLQSVTVTLPDGSNPGGTATVLDARTEDVSEEQRAGAFIQADEEACTWFFPVDQPNFVRPYPGWKITQTDGSVWIVKRHGQTIQQRGVPCICTRMRE